LAAELLEASVAPSPIEDLKRKLAAADPQKVLRILATAPLPPREKVVLQVLWCHTLWGMGETHPSLREEDVIDEAGMSRATFYRARDQLKAWGLVELRQADGDRRRMKVCSFPWRPPANASQSETQPQKSKAVTSFQPSREIPPPSPHLSTTPPPQGEETPSAAAGERREGWLRFAPERRTATASIGAEAPPTTLTEDQAEAARILREVPTIASRRRLTQADAERFARLHALPVIRLAIARGLEWGRDPLAVVIATLTRPERVSALTLELQEAERERERAAAERDALRAQEARMIAEANERARRDLEEVESGDLRARCRAIAHGRAGPEKSEHGFLHSYGSLQAPFVNDSGIDPQGRAPGTLDESAAEGKRPNRQVYTDR